MENNTECELETVGAIYPYSTVSSYNILVEKTVTNTYTSVLEIRFQNNHTIVIEVVKGAQYKRSAIEHCCNKIKEFQESGFVIIGDHLDYFFNRI